MPRQRPKGAAKYEPAIRFSPSGREITVTPGTTLLEAAGAAGVPLGSSCSGEAACGWCRVTVLRGGDRLTRPTAKEEALLARIEARADERIACLAAALGDVEITTTYW